MDNWGYVPIKGYTGLLLKFFGHPHPHGRFLQRLVRNFIDMDSNLTLDVGCGEGVYCLEFSKRNKRIFGMDYSFEAIEHAKEKKFARVIYPQLVVADAQALPFKNTYFDQLICFDVLEHVADPDRALAEIYRVAIEDAKVIISIPNKYYFKQPILPFDFSAHLQALGHIHSGYSLEEVKEKLIAHGFSLVRFKYFHKFFSRLISELAFLVLGARRISRARKNMYKYRLSAFIVFLIVYPIMLFDNVLPRGSKGGFILLEARKGT